MLYARIDQISVCAGWIELASMRELIKLPSVLGLTELTSMRGVIALGSFGVNVETRIFHTPPSRTSTSVQRPSIFSGPPCPCPVV